MWSQFSEDLHIFHVTEKVGDRFRLKDQTPKEILSKVVYLFQCPNDLDSQYIGFTTRSLEERIKEHRRGDTAIAEHTERCKNCTIDTINIDNFSILKKCRTNMEARINEAILINRRNPKLNVQLVKPGITHTLLIFTWIRFYLCDWFFATRSRVKTCNFLKLLVLSSRLLAVQWLLLRSKHELVMYVYSPFSSVLLWGYQLFRKT